MRFSDIIGFEELKQTLVAAVRKGHIPHAQLWLGREGSPHLALSLGYATFLNCESRSETSTDSCGTCASCYKYDRYIHPDLHFVFPTATTKQVTKREDAVSSAFLKEWREFLKNKPYGNLADWAAELGVENKQCIIPVQEGRNIIKSLSLKSFEANYKVMLIWLPELMNASAANSILKILEEPPEKTIFLLVAQQIEQVLPTILSRTQLVSVRPYTDAELVATLTQHYKLPSEKAHQTALLANGNLNQALRLLEAAEQTGQHAFRHWMRLCVKPDITALIKEADRFATLDKESQKGVLQYGLTILRETLTFQYVGEEQTRLMPEAMEFVQQFSKVINERNLVALSSIFNRTYYEIERNANPRMAFLSLSLRIGNLLKMK
ncbi:MAG: DNA polymerase III subunit delta [Cytophagales bacterium]|nr:DNA polymerase III subunit delta [Bernardetiaceae bacterium]MDW8204174.1 DNA polymerase III subunit delta [Cytophagales bacterium]